MKKKYLKILAYSAGGIFILSIVVAGIIFFNLPSASDIGKYFMKAPEPAAAIKGTVEPLPPVPETMAASNQLQEEVAAPLPSTPQAPTITSPQLTTQELREFLDEKTPVSAFCDKLALARSGPMKILKSSENISVEDEEEFSDLRLEAILPLAKSAMKKPEMQKLIAMILQSESLDENQKQELESQGLLNKAHFYSQIYSAYNEIQQNVPEYEDIVDRGYLMYKLNDVIALRPNLQEDQRVQKFCADSEYLFNTHSPVNFNNEKETFERLISELGIQQNEIKYNPDYKTKLEVKFSGNSLQMGGGWLNELVPETTTQQ